MSELAYRAKMKNKRIYILRRGEDYEIVAHRLITPDEDMRNFTPNAAQFAIKNKILVSRMLLSEDGINAVREMLNVMLE